MEDNLNKFVFIAYIEIVKIEFSPIVCRTCVNLFKVMYK